MREDPEETLHSEGVELRVVKSVMREVADRPISAAQEAGKC